MATRNTYTSVNTPATSGDFLDQYAGHVDRILDQASFIVTSVAGTTAVTGTVDDQMLEDTGPVVGQKFTITWPAADPSTLDLNSTGAKSVLLKDGTTPATGEITSGARSLVEYVGGAYRILNHTPGQSVIKDWQVFDATGIWTKPAGIADDQPVLIMGWGAGGGGQVYAGGGGGAYKYRIMRAGDLSATETVTVADGGAVATEGGQSSFGDPATPHLVAYGGGRGVYQSTGGGGGGAAGGGVSGTPGPVGGGGLTGKHAMDSYGGGMGGRGFNDGGGKAGYGGGGGGGGPGGVGGTSNLGGDGGDDGAPGARPGGGGGAGAVGGGGRVIIAAM